MCVFLLKHSWGLWPEKAVCYAIYPSINNNNTRTIIKIRDSLLILCMHRTWPILCPCPPPQQSRSLWWRLLIHENYIVTLATQGIYPHGNSHPYDTYWDYQKVGHGHANHFFWLTKTVFFTNIPANSCYISDNCLILSIHMAAAKDHPGVI